MKKVRGNAMGHFIGYQQEHEQALYIRKKVHIEQEIEKVTMRLSALGVVKGFCNGEEIDNDLLTPGWTDFHKRIPFYTFDLTKYMREGQNVLAFTLGNGWGVGTVAWFGKKHYSKQPLMWCDIEIVYSDGTTECVGSDNTFRLTFGQIVSNDLFDGEVWDARCDVGEFASANYDDSAWEYATIHEGYTERLGPAMAPLTRKKERYSGTYLYEQGGYHIYDFMQNHAGVPEIAIHNATSGTKLTFIYGEMLDEDGNVYTKNLRLAKATDVYICREGNQSFCPHMTFHGYRYIGVRVEGACQLEGVESVAIYSDIPFHSTFSCSDETINQLFRNIIASQKSNFINVPTDCPQRDERLGWTGDVQIFCRSAMLNADCRDFFQKYLVDVLDAQQENGMIDWVAPSVCVDFDQMYGSPGWGDVITVLPYEYYCMYQDDSMIRKALPAAKRWLQYCINDSEEYVRPDRGYGDWLSINETTDKTLLSIFYIAYSSLLIAKMSEIVGEDAEEYFELYEEVKETIRKKFILENGKLMSDTQTAYVLAYTFGIMTAEEIRPHLLASLEKHNYHLSTGFLGVKYLLPVLCELGEYDLAYKVFTQKDFPSWCYPVVNGATTMWEAWNCYVKGVGFSSTATNSFNHYAFGAVCEWMYSKMLGIQYTQDGIVICPVIDESGCITWAKGSTGLGDAKISVEWKNCENGWTDLQIQAPLGVEIDLSKYRNIEKIEEGHYMIER